MKYLKVIEDAAKASADLYVYGPIGGDWWGDGITDIEVAEALAELEAETLRVHIDSPGGDAAQGLAIYNLLHQDAANVETIVEGWAASAASIIMQAGDTRTVAENGLVMIHDAWGVMIGNKTEAQSFINTLTLLDDNLAVTYARRAGDINSKARFAELMTAETWFNGESAVTEGLADKILEAKTPNEASVKMRNTTIAMRGKFAARYKNPPKDAEDTATVELMRMRLALAKLQ